MKKDFLYFKIHISFVFTCLLSVLFDLFWLFILYFICLVIHELCHAIVAKKLGYKIGRINLLCSGAVLEAEGDEFSFSDEIKIALAGPIFNLCFTFILVAFWWIYPESYNYTLDLCIINLAIFAYNILPFFPLDGGRVLLAFLSKKLSRPKALKIAKFITIVSAIFLFFVFIFSLFFQPTFTLGVASVNLLSSAFAQDRSAVYKRYYFTLRKKQRIKKVGLETRFLMVKKDMDEMALYKQLDARHYTIFLLVDSDLNVVGKISENMLAEKLLKNVSD